MEVGIAEKEVQKSLAPYLHQRRTQKPYIHLKVACSLDGMMCAEDFSSKWITGQEARIDAHKIRAESQAVVIGAGTALRDNPQLTVRSPIVHPRHPPQRVVLDTYGRVPITSHIFNPQLGPSLLITSTQCPNTHRDQLEALGVEVTVLPLKGEKLPLNSVIDFLSSKE